MAAVEMNPRQKIGLFGGSFDPIHPGHLILACDAMEQLGLEKVIFIPANVSPHKLDHPPAPAHARCEMVAAAIAGDPRFEWDACEVRRARSLIVR
jgi:nicotinate-nucleotide adenylyltransferase